MSLNLRCPVCHSPLFNAETGTGVCCQKNHQFDRARQGYLNLLPGHKKKSKNPGDDKTMVQARTRFLDAGFYQPVAKALTDHLQQYLGKSDTPAILDAGSGEGYYTSLIKQACPEAKIVGLDISKPAIIASSKRDKSIQWLVGSVNDLPIMNEQLDAIVSIFSRCDWQEFQRVLKTSGHAFVLAPGAKHLLSLRQEIYEEVRPYPVDKLLNDLPAQFELVDQQTVQGAIKLTSTEQIMDLLAMTPHYWHVKPRQKAKLASLEMLDCSFEMQLYTIRKTR